MTKYFMLKKIVLALAFVSCSSVWAKPVSVIDDPDDLTARSWLIADADNRVLASKDTETVRPIASITKVFTALTVMAAKQDLSQYIRYKNGMMLTRQELIELALVKSDNHAAELLCKNYIGGYKRCIEDMNSNAAKWGLHHTTLVDATGLLPGNTSTATDLLTLLNIAEQNYLVVDAARKTKVEIQIKKKWYIFKQTNPLIGNKHEFIVSKTGTTIAAGGCIVLTVKTERGLRRVVVLASKNGRTRIPEAEFIYKNLD